MVTFVCSYCDATLKKKQAENHAMRKCRPAAFICIDCHTTFTGQAYKNHLNCLTEQEKHWGQYAKEKHITQKRPQTQPQPKKQTVVEKKQEKQNGDGSGWKGWKNQIKSIIKQNQNKIEVKDLKSKVLKRYKKFEPEKDQKQDQLADLFDQKLKKLKKIKIETYAILE